jgi:hypothetical protein
MKQIDKLEATKTANSAENKKLNNHKRKRFNLMILLRWIFAQEPFLKQKMPKQTSFYLEGRYRN